MPDYSDPNYPRHAIDSDRYGFMWVDNYTDLLTTACKSRVYPEELRGGLDHFFRLFMNIKHGEEQAIAIVKKWGVPYPYGIKFHDEDILKADHCLKLVAIKSKSFASPALKTAFLLDFFGKSGSQFIQLMDTCSKFKEL